MTWKKHALFLLIAGTVIGCKKDDGDGLVSIPPRDIDEVALENDAEIQEFLQTHFYNYEDFLNPPVGFDYSIQIDTIAGDNSGKTPLANQVQALVLNVDNVELGLEQVSGEVPHTLYYLSIRDGEGPIPTVADSVLVQYEGSLLDGTVFDGVSNYIWQHLPNYLRGYSNAVAQWHSATLEGLEQFGDGTSRYNNSGIGLVIMPSGLAYFNSAKGTIPAYAPLIFKIEMGLIVEGTDADGDGIPSIMEDLNGNKYLYDDNTDKKKEESGFGRVLIPNFLDADDDGDGTPTRDEIEIVNGVISFPDADGDGIPDYLDADTK
ncbi:MAG: hypothetical protein RLZZ241_2553 [Bacteroidota bacterium]|jgi:hypothetical protein